MFGLDSPALTYQPKFLCTNSVKVPPRINHSQLYLRKDTLKKATKINF